MVHMVKSLAAHGHIDTERPTDGRGYTVATPGTARNGDPLQSVARDQLKNPAFKEGAGD